MEKSLYKLITKVKPPFTVPLADRKKIIEKAALQIGDATKEDEISALALELFQEYRSTDRKDIKLREISKNIIFHDTSEDGNSLYMLSIGYQQDQLKGSKEFIDLCDVILDNAIKYKCESLVGLLGTDLDEEEILLDGIDTLSNTLNENIIITDFKVMQKPKGKEKEWEFKIYSHHTLDKVCAGIFKQLKEAKEEEQIRVLQHILVANPLARVEQDIPENIALKIKARAKTDAIIKDAKKKIEWLKGDSPSKSVYVDITDKPNVIDMIQKAAVKALTLENQDLLTVEKYKGTVASYMLDNKILMEDYYRMAL